MYINKILKYQIIIYILKMQKADYHYELTPIISNFVQQLQTPSIQSQNVQLQIKYGFLKSNKNQTAYKSLVSSSQIRPINLSQGKNRFNFKVNARCSPDQHNKARSILEQLVEKSGCQVQVKYHLFINHGQEKFLYDCCYEEWMRICKEQLIKHQYNFLYKNRLFRINLTQKIKQEKKVIEKIKDVLSLREKGTGVLRFKHINVYKVHEYYEIWSSIVFETSEEDWFTRMNTLIYQKGDDISQKVKAIIDEKIKSKYEIKHQLQLKFTQEGIDLIRKGDNIQTKSLFSRAFDFFTEITQKMSKSEQELIKMMKQFGLEEKKQKQEAEIKEEEKTKGKKQQALDKFQQIEYIVKK